MRSQLTSDEAADLLGLTRHRVVQLFNDGILPGVKTPRGLLFNSQDVAALRRKRRRDGKRLRDWNTRSEIDFLENLPLGGKRSYQASMGTRACWGEIDPAKVAEYLRRTLA